MNISALQSFASDARRRLMGAVSAKLDAALARGSSARADIPSAVERLEQEIREYGGEQGRQHVVERYAYRWFNRIIAFRYMDVHGFTAVPVVSAVELTDVNGLPGVLAAAKRGEYDEEVFGGSSTMGNAKLRDTVEALFNGSLQSDDPQGQAYGLLLQAECRYWSRFMPFMFEQVDSMQGKVDELLMPADLLAEGSVLRQAVVTMTPDDCEDVEIIGWLYQFYIAERKTEVMNGFSKSKKAGADEIPAATQLFTPDWIVRYLVQNTVGRLWMQNHPDSQLYRDWEYYIQPEPEQNDQSEFLHIDGPEELTVCDPACGSGHMVTYAFDLLYGIYEEQGYSPSEIPGLILANNLYGMEIDERAANLAAFALTMKARAKDRRFFRDGRRVEPHIRLISKERFTSDEVRELNELYKVSLDDEVWNTYANADIVGSLIQPPQELVTLAESQTNDSANDEAVTERRQSNWREVGPHEGQSDDAVTLFRTSLAERATTVFKHTRYLAQQYKAVVANPPYMGSKNMSDELKRFVQDRFEDGKADLFAAFMYRCFNFVPRAGRLGFMSPYVWMFIASYEALRKRFIQQEHISSLIQLEYSGFEGATVPICTFVLQHSEVACKSMFVRLSDYVGAKQQAPRALEIIAAHNAEVTGSTCEYSDMIKHFYAIDQHDFAQIPGSPIVYWLSEAMMKTFAKGEPLEEVAKPRQGLATADNNRFVREWWEVGNNRTSFCCTSREEASQSGAKWFPYNKGGDFRKWYGNQEHVINWEHDGKELVDFRPRSVIRNPQFYFESAVSWSNVTSGVPSFRYYPEGFIFSHVGDCLFGNSKQAETNLLSICNASVVGELLAAIAPTLHFEVGQVAQLPIVSGLAQSAADNINDLICVAQQDWDSCETSWEYQRPTLLNQSHEDSMEHAIASLSQQWQTLSEEQRQREIRNNELVADAYGVRDDVPCDVPLERVSLKRNSAFVYPGKTPAERDELFARDIVKEFISYAVGCMFGRYSIDKPGLILASQGETIDDFHERVPNIRFEPDKDNVIPVSEVDCFEDDIVSRFRRFLEITFGSKHLAENLAYIERTLGKSLRKYFVNDFYNDHVAMYKNRPIYWQYSSRTDNKGAFKALIYMHRYTPATTHTVLEYLRDFTAKIADQANQLERSDRAKDKREAEKLHKAVTECKAYEDNVLYPLATRNLEIDLDDGVLVNYLRMGQALRTIPAIERKRKDVATWTWPVHPLEEA
ncbi:BREX-1 system adenine-specific DNA-methyltransferase PglX [Bifidobacterium saeculare]|uniref:BREX-1 system adenine-specific DNA-methyltransferase PglX n=1 Tax=Bifidobacterium pullorum TaxID=78448 RepID=UPI00187505F5|nr:BREX-1 system adenine-specific DNA-methyltransferase PglX [Bifidobacterium pullorum]MBE5064978.1 BREX-1 system adenine-specific DNA-methyltransferase PglX [Bifidobacterium pullorum subsp. saeculare]